jgi:hypothetical protein
VAQWLIEDARELGQQWGKRHADSGCDRLGCEPDYPALYLDSDYFYAAETDECNNRPERAELRRVFKDAWVAALADKGVPS